MDAESFKRMFLPCHAKLYGVACRLLDNAEDAEDLIQEAYLKLWSKREELTSKPQPEVTVTQEMRQEAFDNWTTTDDHGMQIYGIAKDQNGKEYFMMKNSWGEYGPYKGFWYVSKPYVAYKTMNIVINKNAIPKDIRKKLGI